MKGSALKPDGIIETAHSSSCYAIPEEREKTPPNNFKQFALQVITSYTLKIIFKNDLGKDHFNWLLLVKKRTSFKILEYAGTYRWHH